jgi:hypothetical protein
VQARVQPYTKTVRPALLLLYLPLPLFGSQEASLSSTRKSTANSTPFVRAQRIAISIPSWTLDFPCLAGDQSPWQSGLIVRRTSARSAPNDLHKGLADPAAPPTLSTCENATEQRTRGCKSRSRIAPPQQSNNSTQSLDKPTLCCKLSIVINPTQSNQRAATAQSVLGSVFPLGISFHF